VLVVYLGIVYESIKAAGLNKTSFHGLVVFASFAMLNYMYLELCDANMEWKYV